MYEFFLCACEIGNKNNWFVLELVVDFVLTKNIISNKLIDVLIIFIELYYKQIKNRERMNNASLTLLIVKTILELAFKI